MQRTKLFTDSDLEPAVQSGEKRDRRGRVAAGNKLGKGHGRPRKVRDLDDALRSACSPADVAAIVEKLVDRAKSGHVKSAMVVLDRVLGRTRQHERTTPALPLSVEDPAACVQSATAIVAALGAGTVSLDQALVLVSLIERAWNIADNGDIAREVQSLTEERNASI